MPTDIPGSSVPPSLPASLREQGRYLHFRQMLLPSACRSSATPVVPIGNRTSSSSQQSIVLEANNGRDILDKPNEYRDTRLPYSLSCSASIAMSHWVSFLICIERIILSVSTFCLFSFRLWNVLFTFTNYFKNGSERLPLIHQEMCKTMARKWD